MRAADEESDEEEEEVRTTLYSHFRWLTVAQKVEEFYTLGSMELLECRRRLAEFSLPRSLVTCYV